jgi:hypothetical protein
VADFGINIGAVVSTIVCYNYPLWRVLKDALFLQVKILFR